MFRDPHTLVNPTIVVEVLSPATERWDRGGKLERYRSVSSLRYVLLVAHDGWHVTLYARETEGAWTWTTAGPGERLDLRRLEVTIAVDDLYRGVERVGGPAREARSVPSGA